jgi:outer membrane murein-binding lipoprotein Lpp
MEKIIRALVGAGVLTGTVMLGGCSAPAEDAPTPTAAPTLVATVAPADQPADDTAAMLTLSGAEIGATASSALTPQVDAPFEIFCDEGDYEVAVGTQLTCTFADDNGDTPAYIEITAIDGTQYELSVSVP